MTLQITGHAVRLFADPDDWRPTADFYEQTLGLPPRMRNDTWPIATFELGKGALVVVEAFEEGDADDEPELENLTGRYSGLQLAVVDVQAAFDDLVSKGVAFHRRPERMSWGATMAHMIDPAGNTVTLIQLPGGDVQRDEVPSE